MAFLSGAAVVIGIIVAANPALHLASDIHAGHGDEAEAGVDSHEGHDH